MSTSSTREVPSTAASTDEDPRTEAERRSVLGRAAALLNAFTEREPVLSLGQLTERTALPRSTAHRLAESLVSVGWLERDLAGYRVGLRLFEVGALVINVNRLRDSASVWLQEAHEMSRNAVHLAVLDGFDVVYLDKVCSRELDVPSRIGGRMPAYCTALGKAILAFAPEADIDLLIGDGLRARTARTVVVPAAFRASIAETRAVGVAFESEEAVLGVSCVAAPIRGSGRAIASISITGPSRRFDADRNARIVKRAAEGIWSDLFRPR
jgi:DNA-binding IclR family transcriptional regulator